MRMLIALLLNAAVIFVVARLVPGVRVRGFGTAVAVAVVYSLLAAVLKWLLVLLSLPLVIVTFGLFLLVINGFLLWMTDKLVDGLHFADKKALALATIGITLGGWLVNTIVW
jgi:putative membrane protein